MLSNTSIPKKKIGRPRKQTNDDEQQLPKLPKRGVGRPRKQPLPVEAADGGASAVGVTVTTTPVSTPTKKRKKKLKQQRDKVKNRNNLAASGDDVMDAEEDDKEADGVEDVEAEVEEATATEKNNRDVDVDVDIEDDDDEEDDDDYIDESDGGVYNDEDEQAIADDNNKKRSSSVVGGGGGGGSSSSNEQSDEEILTEPKNKPKATPKKYAGRMSTKISAADSTSGNVSSTTSNGNNNRNSSDSPIGGNGVAAAVVAAATAALSTNGQTTPVRKLRTRNSIGSNASSNDLLATPTNQIQLTPESKAANVSSNSSSSNCGDSNGGTPVPMNLSNSCVAASKKYHNSCPHPAPPSYKSWYSRPYSSTKFEPDKSTEFEFTPPEECPVFKPNHEEFKNPLAYISSIRAHAEKYGLVKLIPPDGWSPPFAVDTSTLRFVPRVQKLNELDAKTRTKLFFLDRIAKFWELQGQTLRIPMVERKILDLHSLHRIVQEEGGMEKTSKDRKWTKVATRMGYPVTKGVGATLKSHYERILRPYDVSTAQTNSGCENNAAINTNNSNASTTTIDDGSPILTSPIKIEEGTDYKVHGIEKRQEITPPNNNNTRRSKRFAHSKVSCGLSKQQIKAEYKRDLLPCFNDIHNVTSSSNIGAPSNDIARRASIASSTGSMAKKPASSNTPTCYTCFKNENEDLMLICEACGQVYHTYCLVPPLTNLPKSVWHCPACVVEEVSKPKEAFGFEQAPKQYSLGDFGKMADDFKKDYFHSEKVPFGLVEREFWRIVSSIDEDVTVEYGADLHTMDHGSGFPTRNTINMPVNGEQYIDSPWNLNNLPLLPDSILGHINLDISGMNAPWMYVGMCFAAFCWHIEDHWSYSINYMHWGDPKTWYGVPGKDAVKFEDTMKRQAPELFKSQPDLLHQLVTIMNPNLLQKEGVPVYRTDQKAGEFVITFPRAYHAGFNQGFNFAEAVNFAPADWLKQGRECVNHYSSLRRFCVFSHDELVCKMALEPEKLTVNISTACYIDMVEMVNTEKKLRKSLLEWGVTSAERNSFETQPDDDRHCQECNTTCFMSAVSCKCTSDIVCLRHYTSLCKCPASEHTLLYRYTLDEMPKMLQKLKSKYSGFERWIIRCQSLLSTNMPKTATINDLREICDEARTKNYPTTTTSYTLQQNLQEAVKCVQVINQLGINKIRTRSEQQDAAQYKLTMNELVLFVEEIDNLCCVIDEAGSVHELLKMGKAFVLNAKEQLALPLDQSNENELQALINEGEGLRIDLPELQDLVMRLKMCRWYRRSVSLRESSSNLTHKDIEELVCAIYEFDPTNPFIEKERELLTQIGAKIEEWELQASVYAKKKTLSIGNLLEIEELLKTGLTIEAQLPSYGPLKEGLRKTREWLKAYEELRRASPVMFFYKMEALMERSRGVPFLLEEMKSINEAMEKAKKWKTDCADNFLKKFSNYTLLEVLMPRPEPVLIDADTRKPHDYDSIKDMSPRQIVDAFKAAELKEMSDMRELRKHNTNKKAERDLFCHCKGAFSGRMHNCQLCRDWFHEVCIHPETLEELKRSAKKSNGCSALQMHWLCASCERTKRPPLPTILPLLITLQELPIRLPEDEALRCLAERAMSWQDMVLKELGREDITALKALICEAAASNKLDEIFNVNNPNVNPTFIASKKPDYFDEDEIGLRIVEDEVEAVESKLAVGEHSKQRDMKAELERLLQQIDLDALYDLMMQGDLLEVTLEEQEQLWSIMKHMPRERLYADALKVIAIYERQEQEKQLKEQQEQRATSLGLEASADANLTSSDDTNDSLLAQSSPNNSNLSGRNSNAGRKRRSLPDDVGGNNAQRKKQRKADAKKTRKSDSNANAVSTENNKHATTGGGGGSGSIGHKSSATNSAKKRKRRNTLASSAANVGSGGNTATSNSTNKKRQRTTTLSTAVQQQQQQQQRQQHEDDDDDDDDVCRADVCKKPTGNEVDWVQCDGGCNEWFHMKCVGIVPSDVNPDDEYHCVKCKSSKVKTEQPTPTTMVTAAATTAAAAAAATTTTAAYTKNGTNSNNNNNSNTTEATAAAGAGAAATPSKTTRRQSTR